MTSKSRSSSCVKKPSNSTPWRFVSSIQGKLISRNAQLRSVNSRVHARTLITCSIRSITMAMMVLKITYQAAGRKPVQLSARRPATTFSSPTSIDTPSPTTSYSSDEVSKVTAPQTGKEILTVWGSRSRPVVSDFHLKARTPPATSTRIVPSPRGPNPSTDTHTILYAARRSLRSRRGESRCKNCWQPLKSARIKATETCGKAFQAA